MDLSAWSLSNLGVWCLWLVLTGGNDLLPILLKVVDAISCGII